MNKKENNMSGLIRGKRIYPEYNDFKLKPGEYGFHTHLRCWVICTPNGYYGNLSSHNIIEHKDGTNTVPFSIRVISDKYNKKEVWRGFLQHGIWRRV